MQDRDIAIEVSRAKEDVIPLMAMTEKNKSIARDIMKTLRDQNLTVWEGKEILSFVSKMLEHTSRIEFTGSLMITPHYGI